MRNFVVISVICMQLGWSYGIPAPDGVGAYAYQDTAGNRYGGIYDLNNGQVVNLQGDDPTTFAAPFFDFQNVESFFPEYFRNLENLIQEAFAKNAEHQRLALNAARKAYDLTSNQAGYTPNFGFDNRFQGPSSFGFPVHDFEMPVFGANPFAQGIGPNSAFASGAVGPGFHRQSVSINPPNPAMPNININKYAEPAQNQGGSGGGFYSVSSSSYASSANVNGKQSAIRGGETVVNNNGKVTKYSLHN